MGKKSRRSNRKGGSSGQGSNCKLKYLDSNRVVHILLTSNLVPIGFRRLMQLEKEVATESYQNNFYSKALHKIREGLAIIQQFQHASLQNTGSIDSGVFEIKALFIQRLVIVEYRCCRFDKVIQIYNEEKLLPFLYKLYGRLAMLRLDASNENKERVVSLIDTRISEGLNDPHEVSTALEVVMTLTNLKEYDAAIALSEKLGRINENKDIATSKNSIRQHRISEILEI